MSKISFTYDSNMMCNYHYGKCILFLPSINRKQNTHPCIKIVFVCVWAVCVLFIFLPCPLPPVLWESTVRQYTHTHTYQYIPFDVCVCAQCCCAFSMALHAICGTFCSAYLTSCRGWSSTQLLHIFWRVNTPH